MAEQGDQKREPSAPGQAKQNRRHGQSVSDEQVRIIREIADSIRFGSITLVIQDGYLIQIDRNEKIRVK